MPKMKVMTTVKSSRKTFRIVRNRTHPSILNCAQDNIIERNTGGIRRVRFWIILTLFCDGIIILEKT